MSKGRRRGNKPHETRHDTEYTSIYVGAPSANGSYHEYLHAATVLGIPIVTRPLVFAIVHYTLAQNERLVSSCKIEIIGINNLKRVLVNIEELFAYTLRSITL